MMNQGILRASWARYASHIPSQLVHSRLVGERTFDSCLIMLILPPTDHVDITVYSFPLPINNLLALSGSPPGYNYVEFAPKLAGWLAETRPIDT